MRKIILKLVDSKELPSDWPILDDKELLRVVKPYVHKDCLKENPEVVKEIGNAFGKYCNDATLKAIRTLKNNT